MLKHLVAVLIVALCNVSPAVGSEVARVTVMASGVVLLDGKPTTMPALEERLKTLKTANGAVGISATAIFAAESVGMTSRASAASARLVPTS